MKNRFEEFQEPYDKSEDEEFPEIDSNMVLVKGQKMKTVKWRQVRQALRQDHLHDRAALEEDPQHCPNYEFEETKRILKPNPEMRGTT